MGLILLLLLFFLHLGLSMSNDKLKTALDEATRKLVKISMKPDDKSQWPVCVELN